MRKELAALAVLLAACAGDPARAADTLAAARARGALACGVSDARAGAPASGLAGIGPDFCRALAAATGIGAPRFHPVTAAAGFPALLGGEIDVLARATVWSVAREAALDVEFPAVLFLDRQIIAVPPGARPEIGALAGPVCAVRGTHHGDRLLAWAARDGVKLTLREVARADDFTSGGCAAATSQETTLRLVGGGKWTVLPADLGDEPIGPAVRGDDRAWARIVRAVAAALIWAEPDGVTQATARAALTGQADAHAAAFRTETESVAAALGLPPDWALRAVAAGGHYGELFAADLGKDGIPRGRNAAWSAGGQLPAPPFR